MSIMTQLLAGACCLLLIASAHTADLYATAFRLRVSPETGAVELLDKDAGVTWRSQVTRFGEVTLTINGKPQRFPLMKCEVKSAREQLTLTFHPLTNSAALRVIARAVNSRTL